MKCVSVTRPDVRVEGGLTGDRFARSSIRPIIQPILSGLPRRSRCQIQVRTLTNRVTHSLGMHSGKMSAKHRSIMHGSSTHHRRSVHLTASGCPPPRGPPRSLTRCQVRQEICLKRVSYINGSVCGSVILLRLVSP